MYLTSTYNSGFIKSHRVIGKLYLSVAVIRWQCIFVGFVFQFEFYSKSLNLEQKAKVCFLVCVGDMYY